ncbi:SDR family oxidoreductase [Paludibaculum fermentans]|uniref:SDR family oxidoreductase n=1 Tax=Paludibaculum fermentans TaxID=1473598 RepID=A0A7S7NQX2_PALFE|nr:SDR family oxidoreductase [Paludibaculum fermentans]QOY88158.1 SDR family oxidoreductase [Paludibaculum fermentans]
MQRIAITGVTGYIGGRLAPMLLESGYSLRCLVRTPRKLEGRKWTEDARVEIRKTELADADALTRELSGCSAAYYLVHSMMSAGGEYAQLDLQLAGAFAKAAAAAGVTRIIYLGGLGETGPNLSQHLASRRDVESALASTGVPVTVLRAAMIVGSGSASFEILRYLVQRLPVMITPKWVSTRCQPIAVENVLGYLVGVLSVPECAGGTFDIGGSEILPYSEIMRTMAEELKLPRRWIIPVPVLTPRLSSYWIHLVTPLSSSIARPLAEGLKNEVVCREDRITHLVPQKLMNVREAIRAALSQVESRLVETNWSMAGPMLGDPDWSGGTVFRDERSVSMEVPAWAAFRAVCRLGGEHGWYADWLWKIRGALDRLAGGPGLRRGRRDPDSLRYGDALDFWRVVGVDRDQSLSLRAEMRLPGEALLGFRIQDKGAHECTLRQTALFQPRGLFGLLYWYSVLPFHGLIFRGMLAAIQGDALRIAAAEGTRRADAG